MVCVETCTGLLCSHTRIFSNDLINIVSWSLSAVARVGLEKIVYPFLEDTTKINVCMEVFSHPVHTSFHTSI